MTQPPRPNDGSDDYARDHLGRVLRDRFGNPVPGRPPARHGGTGTGGEAGQARPRGRHERPGAQSPSAPSDHSTRLYGDAAPAASPRAGGDRPAPPQYRRASHRQSPRQAQQPARQPYRDQYPPRDPGRRPAQPVQHPERQAPPRAPRPKRRRRRPRIRRILGVLLLVIVVVVGGTAWWVDSSLNRIDALANWDGRPGNTRGSNWLLVGSDSRAGLSEEQGAEYAAGDLSEGGQRTDTIIVVHVPAFGGKPTMVSIPRDSYVEVPGYGMDKINSAFSYGGPQLLQQTVEQNTGMRIDHYMELGFAGFAGIVDAVGGVTLCPKEPIDDPMAGLNVQAGCQTMDGPTALGYVRTRYTSANGDLDRVERQREFLTAVIKKVGSLSTMVNPFRALPLISNLTDAVTVDDGDHVWHLASLGLGLVRGSEQQTVPVSGFADTDAGSVVLWDDAAAEELFSTMR
ncbi:LCP family protein [uncultured Corynebacterium sp.]|uniref:LCP family protein n=1 Tax=uncultured Corynebacterium sp. TaxID=159447 RepID=UPI0025F06647|nr:LCP family protein [uncultured Corynebacterium sp.]